jgi:hypothetical protein
MSLNWLPHTALGLMVGDYMSTSFVSGKAFPVFAVARARDSFYHEPMYTPSLGLSVG